MNRKILTRLLSVLLVVVMTFGLLPVSASAAWWNRGNTEQQPVVDTQAATDDGFYRILHLDCGRKYFSKDWIIALLYEMKDAGYNQLQLAFGNDGLRFLLDDMSFTANGTTYSNETVVTKVKAGNKAQNSSGDESYLTETEMNAIIAKAKEFGIEIVPLLNLPGHANAILDIADDVYNASGSNNTLNVVSTSDTARNFGMAIFKKYVDYFYGKGCKFFNFGADEYANDASGTFSFSRLNTTEYSRFVTFINSLAAYITEKGMTPRAFNDGLYYNGQTNAADTNIQCCYWSSGWGDYPVASATTIANNGHGMINTNGDFYYVLGKSDKFDSDYSYASNFSNTAFMKSNISNPVGSMFCIWCDYPNAETETVVAQKTRLVLRAMAARMQDNSINTINKDVVTNGFNADGTINKDSTNPGGETGETKVELTLKVGQDSTTYTQDGDVTSKVTKDDNFDEVASAKIEPKQQTTEGKEEAVTSVSSGEAYYIKKGSQYLDSSANWVDDISSAAQWTWDGSYLKNGKDYLSYSWSSGFSTTTNRNSATTITVSGGTYTYHYSFIVSQSAELGTAVKLGDGETISKTEITFTGVSKGETSIKIGDTRYYITVEYKEQTVNVTVGNTATVTVSGTLDKTDLNENFATVAVSGTKMTVTGIATGDTYVIVGDTKYNIHVTVEDLTKTDTAKLEYWITNRALKVRDDLKSETRTNKKDSKTYTAYYLEIPATTAGINSENGLPITDFAPEQATNLADSGDTANYVYWIGRALNKSKVDDSGSETEEQTYDGGDDNTLSGILFTRIRYLNGTWSVYDSENKKWEDVDSNYQLVAYYMQRTKVTDEVTTDVVDWGPAPGDLFWITSDFAVLDFAVQYESGEKVPDTFKNDKTIAYAAEDATRTIGRVNAVETADYEVYMITLTPTSDGSDVIGTNVTQLGTYAYNGTEKVVWVDNEADLGEFADESTHHADFSVGGAATIPSITIKKGQGMLVTYYVRAKKTETSLTVRYVDRDSNTEFYTYEIAVWEGTLFDSNIGLGNPWKGPLANGTVTNKQNNTQTVSADLSTLPKLSASYGYSDYECVDVTRSDDRKEVTLYYTFKNTTSFIIDFGTKVAITADDMGYDNTNWEESLISGAKFGKAELDKEKHILYYTPTKPLLETESLQLKVGKKNASGVMEYNTRNVNFIPASNVLYEENFLTTTDTANWTMTPAGITSVQQLQKANDGKTYNVFGYDNAYAASATENGVWKATGLTTTAATGELTADFYGNAFDLIGNCGPTTGRVVLIIAKQSTRQGLKAAIVDTRYTSDIYQVPLAHLEMGAEGAYTAYVYAAGLKATGSKQAAAYSAPALMSVNAANDPAADILAEYGLSVADAEYIGSDQIAASPIAVRRAPAIAAYAATIERDAGDHVEIAGFRVYRDTTGTVAQNYPTAEQNLTYTNIIKLMGNKLITATVENGVVENVTASDYQNQGGPQNEVYLAKEQAISFGVSTGDPIQVSLRAVSGTSDYNGTEISSITEMYYEVEPKLVDGQYTVTIMNKQSDGLLAIGNVKVPNSVTVQTTSELSDNVILASVRAVYAAAPEPVEPELFTPDTFKVHVTSLPMFRSKIVTLGITVSKDVAYVTVNGRTYTPSQFFSRWLKTMTIPVTETISRSETRTYTIIAYNSDGTASEPIVVKG